MLAGHTLPYRGMTDLSFPGYRSFGAPPDDPYRLKWDAVRPSLDGPLPVLNLSSPEDVDLVVNTAVKYLKEPSGVDVWQEPAVTWDLKRGDCEDYAILKYAILRKAAIPVRVVIGEIKSISGNEPHAWCAAYLDGAWRALDQKFPEIIKVSDYINWLPLAAMHDDTVLLFTPAKTFTINQEIGS